MEIDILTLFPSMFTGFINESIIKRAIDKELVKINIHDIRSYSIYKNNQVDDYQYGGGPGMVLMCDPIFRAIDDLKRKDSIIIMLSPGGYVFEEKIAIKLTKYKHIILLCGHYEGFDERIKSIVDMEISIGNYILTGGEIPAMAISDAIIRLIPGVINKESLESESFNDEYLDYPVYTKPVEYRGMLVPEVLTSGNHQKIKEFRDKMRIELTKNRGTLNGK